jgi:hypothetical protein
MGLLGKASHLVSGIAAERCPDEGAVVQVEVGIVGLEPAGVAAQHVAAVGPEHGPDAARDLSLHGDEDHVDALRVGERSYAFDTSTA